MQNLLSNRLVPSLALSLVGAATAQAETPIALPDMEVSTWGNSLSPPDSVAREDFQRFDRRDVGEALNTLPGVYLQGGGNRNERQVSVRGFDSRQVPLFIDGVPVYVPYDGNIDLGRFLTSDLAGIEVSKGYASLLQGPNMLGGAINLATRRPTRPFEAGFGLSQGWARDAGRVGRAADFSLGGKGRQGFFQASGAWLDRDARALPGGLRDSDDLGSHGERANSASRDARGTLKLGLTPNASDEYVLTYFKQDGDKQSPPYAGSDPSFQSRYWRWPDWNKEGLYFNSSTQLGERTRLRTRLYRDTFQNTLEQYNSRADLEARKGSRSQYDDWSDGAGVELSQGLREDDSLAFALHWKQDVHRERQDRGPWGRFEDRTWSLSSEYQWALDAATRMIFGVSYDWRESLEAREYKTDRQGRTSEKEYPDNDAEAFNWQWSLVHPLDEASEVQLNLADRSRFATLKDRYTTFRPAVGQTVLVNPDLDPERARLVELRYRRAFGQDTTLDLALFHNRVRDAIQATDLGPNLAQNRNVGEIVYQGLDLGLRGRPAQRLELGANYSWIDSDWRSSEAGVVTGLPRHKLFAWADWQALEPLHLVLSGEARSRTYSDTGGSRRAAGFALLNLHGEYQASRELALSLALNNLADRRYAYNEGFIEEGRTLWLGMKYRY
ncbi:TonB-dependent receptor [Pseudomonas aeruginosa]|uniref:TonB-dependent receptor n=15 Tax=Pseudomonas aeruginosa TaxID=287 RepID=A0AAQ3LN46_PSEAI|nr:TonB-dependent receptor [Pseudomonas aeruginosa]AUA80594.1 TonB-dependent receptor [Pseudomonas aeruginosa]AUB05225.1 TonB-dependent receptor [Pseudomonas aeruginosa]AVJ98427.1 tonB dependent receptor family protein [Pseudomonas aeruginosa]AVK14783.1 tonB dependent receptor family protein [Pseudomonas aeruginosa]AVR86748.1 TonB-dependent receptor [Pseudomonas aeruginosa]